MNPLLKPLARLRARLAAAPAFSALYAVTALIALVTASPSAMAQSRWREVAVPAYSPPAFVQGQWQHWYLPRSEAFVKAAGGLEQALRQHCTGAPKLAAQQRWRESLLAWDQLAAVAVGPVVQRRSVRRIDFTPTRPALIERAINDFAASPTAATMERVGSAARGFAALEWLLWSRPGAKLDAPACRFAVALGSDVLDEARAIEAGFKAQAKDFEGEEPDETKVVEAMSEVVNQWVGGLEQLRLQGIERPLHEAEARNLAKPVFSRAASGASAAEREARWSTLRSLAAYDGAVAPAAGTALLPMETYLRGKGLNPLADRLHASVATADRGVMDARNDTPARLKPAASQLAALAALVQAEVAPALDIRIGFSDADGD